MGREGGGRVEKVVGSNGESAGVDMEEWGCRRSYTKKKKVCKVCRHHAYLTFLHPGSSIMRAQHRTGWEMTVARKVMVD